MSWLSDLFRSTLDHSGDANEMVSDTLKPTERELLEADAAWWKDCSGHWKDAWDAVEAERVDLLIANCDLRNALLDIRIYTQDQKSGTAQKVHRMAKDALK